MFVFSVPPTAKVIWRRGHGLVSSDRLVKSGIEPTTPVYKASGLYTTPRRYFRCIYTYLIVRTVIILVVIHVFVKIKGLQRLCCMLPNRGQNKYISMYESCIQNFGLA